LFALIRWFDIICMHTNIFTRMNLRTLLFILLLPFTVSTVSGQLFKLRKRVNEEDVERHIGIARIKVEAKPVKGTPIAEIANFPAFFGEKSDQLRYARQSIISKLPPSTGDSLREVTSDSMAVYLRQNLYDWDATGENRNSVRRKKNSIHDLPNEDYQKFLADSVLDEAIDISCYWYFIENKSEQTFQPEVHMKASFFDKVGASRPPIETTLSAQDLQTAHFKEAYGYALNLNKGISSKEIENGGIAGNIVADVYLQALKKLLAKK